MRNAAVLKDADALAFIVTWNTEADSFDQPKPPNKGTPGSKWYWDTPAGRRARRRERAGLRKIKDGE